MNARQFISNRFFSILLVCVVVLSACGVYMKMNPPGDVDKANVAPNNSCYLATAANMLAGAGYGNGATLQARADDIYADLTAQFGITNTGWTDTALTWWLNSANNTWANNPYTIVTVYGNKSPKLPWANANGAQFIANELRRCLMVGLSISWPTNALDNNGAPIIGTGGHAITAWGDHSGNAASLPGNPGRVRLTDSDTDAGGDVQVYTYDVYTNPNPGGANEGNGWYFNYDPNHPYIKHIVTLAPTDDPSDDRLTQKVVGSYRLHQSAETEATDLHYTVGTDVNILTYRTYLDWTDSISPTISEADPRTRITVDWDLSEKPVPQGTWVTITTEFVLPSWNAITYEDVYFTYPITYVLEKPWIYWRLDTPFLEAAEKIPNVTGGYVIGSFEIYDRQNFPDQPIAEYRLVHQYSYTQAPEFHTFILQGSDKYQVANLRFGHSYSYPDLEQLWGFEDWLTVIPEEFNLGEQEVQLDLDWKGLLPYPPGEDITGRLADLKQGLLFRLP